MFANPEKHRRPDRRRRLAGAALVVANLFSAGTGYAIVTEAFGTGLVVLDAAAPMQLAGSIALAVLMCCTGRSPFIRYSGRMWWMIGRLAVGNAVVSVAYPLGGQILSLGGVAVAAVIGGLLVGLAKVLRHGNTAWTRKHLLGRLVVLGGVLWFAQPGHIPLNPLGLGCAALVAVCTWNIVTALGRLAKENLEDRGAALGNLLSVPLLLPAVFAIRGTEWVRPDLFIGAGLAGLLTLFLPVLLLNAALRRTTERDVGAVQSLTSPVYALVGQIGAATGLLSSTQWLAPDRWAAIIVIAGAALVVSMIREPHENNDGGAGRRG